MYSTDSVEDEEIIFQGMRRDSLSSPSNPDASDRAKLFIKGTMSEQDLLRSIVDEEEQKQPLQHPKASKKDEMFWDYSNESDKDGDATAPNEDNSAINKLPHEVLGINVFSFLSFEYLPTLCCVSRKWLSTITLFQEFYPSLLGHKCEFDCAWTHPKSSSLGDIDYLISILDYRSQQYELVKEALNPNLAQKHQQQQYQQSQKSVRREKKYIQQQLKDQRLEIEEPSFIKELDEALDTYCARLERLENIRMTYLMGNFSAGPAAAAAAAAAGIHPPTTAFNMNLRISSIEKNHADGTLKRRSMDINMDFEFFAYLFKVLRDLLAAKVASECDAFIIERTSPKESVEFFGSDGEEEDRDGEQEQEQQEDVKYLIKRHGWRGRKILIRKLGLHEEIYSESDDDDPLSPKSQSHQQQQEVEGKAREISLDALHFSANMLFLAKRLHHLEKLLGEFLQDKYDKLRAWAYPCAENNYTIRVGRNVDQTRRRMCTYAQLKRSMECERLEDAIQAFEKPWKLTFADDPHLRSPESSNNNNANKTTHQHLLHSVWDSLCKKHQEHIKSLRVIHSIPEPSLVGIKIPGINNNNNNNGNKGNSQSNCSNSNNNNNNKNADDGFAVASKRKAVKIGKAKRVTKTVQPAPISKNYFSVLLEADAE